MYYIDNTSNPFQIYIILSSSPRQKAASAIPVELNGEIRWSVLYFK
jgi:hypothetical protein